MSPTMATASDGKAMTLGDLAPGGADAGKDLDFDFSDVESAAAHATRTVGAALDLDVGTATVPDTAFTATQKLRPKIWRCRTSSRSP